MLTYIQHVVNSEITLIFLLIYNVHLLIIVLFKSYFNICIHLNLIEQIWFLCKGVNAGLELTSDFKNHRIHLKSPEVR